MVLQTKLDDGLEKVTYKQAVRMLKAQDAWNKRCGQVQSGDVQAALYNIARARADAKRPEAADPCSGMHRVSIPFHSMFSL